LNLNENPPLSSDSAFSSLQILGAHADVCTTVAAPVCFVFPCHTGDASAFVPLRLPGTPPAPFQSPEASSSFHSRLLRCPRVENLTGLRDPFNTFLREKLPSTHHCLTRGLCFLLPTSLPNLLFDGGYEFFTDPFLVFPVASFSAPCNFPPPLPDTVCLTPVSGGLFFLHCTSRGPALFLNSLSNICLKTLLADASVSPQKVFWSSPTPSARSPLFPIHHIFFFPRFLSPCRLVL